MAEKKKDYETTREGQVRIKHPQAGLGKCLPESLDVWLDKGWSVVAPDYKESSASARTSKTGSDPDDKK